MTGRMYALSWDVGADGMVRLEQPCGCDEPAVIDLHPAQLRVLCEQTGILDAAPLPVLEKRLVARFRGLLAALEFLAEDVWLNEIVEEVSDGLAYEIAMRHFLDDFRELAQMVGANAAHGEEEGTVAEAAQQDVVAGQAQQGVVAGAAGQGVVAAVAGNENPAPISVTEKARPGRPATGKAMTSAERQAKHRAKQQELSLKGGHE